MNTETLRELVAKLRAEVRRTLPGNWQAGRSCPECGVSAERPKCFFEMGGHCPRHDPENYEPSPYLIVPDRLSNEAADAIEALIERVRVLEDALRKAETPVWFYHPDHTEVCQWSPHEVVDDYYDPEPGEYVFEVECARPLPPIWCAVRVTADEDADERFTLTEHASEDEARTALSKEPRT